MKRQPRRKKPAPAPLNARLEAVVALRRAWRESDAWTKKFVVMAIKDLMAGLYPEREAALALLRDGLTEEQRTELLEEVFPKSWRSQRA